MTTRRARLSLFILAAAAVIAVVAGTWLAARQSSSPTADQAQLYPDLKQQLDAVQSVRIYKGADAPTVEIVRKENGWSVPQRGGYAADPAKLRTLLRALADAKVLEEKTSNAANYKSLGVEDVADAAASGVRIELTGPAAPVNLIVGKSGPGVSSQYVRKAGEQQSWLVDASIDSSSSPDAWVRKEILDVSADRVQAVSVAAGAQKPYVAAKASRADANFAVTDLPRGKKLSAPSAANGLATALSGVTLADVQSAEAFAGASPDARATYTTFDGLVVQLDGWERNDKRYIAVKAAYDAQIAERFKTPTAAADDKAQEPKNENDVKAEASTKEAPKPDAAADAKTIGVRTGGWVYEIPSYKYDQIFKPVDQLTAS